MRRYLVMMLAITLAACKGEIVGDNVFIDTEVVFLNEDGTPAANEQVYIAEQIGTKAVTEVMTTDYEGRVHLRGYYCTPTSVAVNGGSIVISIHNLKKKHVETISNDRKPALEATYGVPGRVPLPRPRSTSHGCAG